MPVVVYQENKECCHIAHALFGDNVPKGKSKIKSLNLCMKNPGGNCNKMRG